MNIVYLIRSLRDLSRVYVGRCSNLKNRLREHNGGECSSTAAQRPWKVEVAIYFSDQKRARVFERYLKTGSGRAFSKKHF